MARKAHDCEAQSPIAKNTVEGIAAIVRIVRKQGWDYDQWRYVVKRVREATDLRPARKGRPLPRVLTAAEFERFYQVIDKATDHQHGLMLRLLFYTGLRVSELCRLRVVDVDLDACKVRVEKGKGSKDRYVLFGKGFASALRTHLLNHPSYRYVFQTERHGPFTTRRVQQIVKHYAKIADVKATPHTFRHQCITWLSRHSGLADAELQLLTGHARRETLAVYQHVALDADLEAKYQSAMKPVDL